MELLGFDFASIDLGELWRRIAAFTAPRWLPSLGVAVLAGLVYLLARWILDRAMKRALKSASKLDDAVVRLLRQAILLSIVAWAVWRMLEIWSQPTAAGWVQAIWLGMLFVPASRFVGDVLATAEVGLIARTATAFDETALPLVNRCVRFLIIALGVVLALAELGVNIAPLLAGAGVMGIAFSLAAKDTLSNLIAGVLLIVDRPFQVGDRIELWTAPNETGSWGDVVEIGLRATKIKNPDNLVVVVPNNEIMQRDIVNYTMSGDDIRLRIPFSVAYESDIERAKAILIRIALAVEGIKKDPKPVVITRGFGPSEVNLELRVWILDARERRRLADEISEQALAGFGEAGIQIPYPRRELFIRSSEGSGEKGAVGQPGSRGGVGG